MNVRKYQRASTEWEQTMASYVEGEAGCRGGLPDCVAFERVSGWREEAL